MNFRNIAKLARRLHIRPAYLIIPGAISLVSALFNGLSAGLLIPILNGLISDDFASAYHIPILKNILLIFPEQFMGNPRSALILLASLAFTAAVISHLMRYVSVLGASFIVRRVTCKLSKHIFNKYLDQGKAFFDRWSFSYLNDILHVYPYSISQKLVESAVLLNNAFVVCIFLVIMFFLSWKITACVVLAAPALHYVFSYLIAKIKIHSQALTLRMNELSRKSFGILTCIPLVKVSAREEEEKREYSEIAGALENVHFSIEKIMLLVEPLQRIFALVIVLVAIIMLAPSAARSGAIGFSKMFVYFYLFREVSYKIGSFNEIRAGLASIFGMFERVVQMIELKEETEVKGGDEECRGIHDGIEIRNLSFSYSLERYALKGISFSVPKGKMTAIVGPTGAGKTTIVNLLLRLYDCPAATIFMDDKDIRGFTIRSLMPMMALVSQETYLFNDTLRNNIAYGNNDVSEAMVAEAVRRARLSNLVQSLPKGLDTEIGDRGATLSGGERQRVSIARAILKGAEILILDEATSALDTKTETLIHEAIEEAAKDKTTIVIAHRLSTIRNADKIVVIEGGELIEQGAMQELLERKGKFYEYWNEQKFY